MDLLASNTAQGARISTLDASSSAESQLPRIPGREWCEVDDILFLEDHRYLAEQSCLETQAVFQRNGQSERLTWWHWIYTAAEIRRMLAEAGLNVTHCFGSLDQQPFTVGNPLFVVAMKGG